jgi:MFS family permease
LVVVRSVVSTFFTLLIPLAQSGTQLIIIRVLAGIGLGFALSAPFPIAAELIPAQHRRTNGAIYEVMLASAFTLLLVPPGFLHCTCGARDLLADKIERIKELRIPFLTMPWILALSLKALRAAPQGPPPADSNWYGRSSAPPGELRAFPAFRRTYDQW